MSGERENRMVLCGVRGAPALPVRKRLDHRGPLSIDVSRAWYFITICAEGHRPWQMTKRIEGRAGAPRTPPTDGTPPVFDEIARIILRHAREYHEMGKWRISLFMVMPDHLHFIVHAPTYDGKRTAERSETADGGAPALPGDGGVRGALALPIVKEDSDE